MSAVDVFADTVAVPVRKRYGKGARLDKLARPTLTHRQILGAYSAVTNLPETVTNSDLIAKTSGIKDQGATESCVGQSISEMAELYMAGVYGVFLWLSAWCCYWAARSRERFITCGATSAPLQDSGAEPTLAVLGVEACGIATEAAWPSTIETVNDEETVGEAESAINRIGVTQWGTVAAVAGQHRILAVRQALAAFHGSSVGGSVNASTDAFQDADGAAVLSGWGVGGWDHMITLIDYMPDPQRVGHYLFRLRNHWSISWAAQSDIPGTVWVDESFVNSMADLTILTATAMTRTA